MAINLLEIGAQTEQLGACRLSLLMGVYTDDNKIADFLKFARSILRMESAILAFKNEPYIWYGSDEGVKAFLADSNEQLERFFEGDNTIIDHQHACYSAFSDYVHGLGVEHQRLVAFHLRDEQQSIGTVLLFDDRSDEYTGKQLEIVSEFVQSLLSVLKLRVENAELKEMYEQQSALNFSKTKFFQIIAHDLRAPFHGLLGFSEVLAQERDSLDESSIQNIADYLSDTAQSTYNLLESLLNWAMAEGGRFEYHPINFDLNQSAKIVCSVLNSLAVKKNIQLLNEIPTGLKVNADINMITSVAQNLVSNALKFTNTDGQGKVILRAEERDEFIRFSVQDTGLGMNQNQVANIFEQQIKVSIKGTAGEQGTGLGLVLCKRFVDLNHGSISVHSKEGEGTLFVVDLPKATSSHQVLTVETLPKAKAEAKL